MLQIIKQYCSLIKKSIYVDFSQNSEYIGKELELKDLSNKQQSLLKVYKNNIFRFDLKNDSKNEIKVRILQHQLSLIGFISGNGKSLEENGEWSEETQFVYNNAKKLLENFDKESKVVTGETRLDTQRLDSKVKSSTDLNEKNEILKTQEEFGKIEGTFWSEKSGEELKNLVNMKSLNKILNLPNTSLFDLYNNIISISNKNHKSNDGLYYNYRWYDIGNLKKLLEKNGYESNGIFGGEEMGALIQIIEDVVNTQRKIPNLSYKEKISILLDYNIDGVLDNDVHFYTKEIELFKEIKDEKEFSNMLKNLGYSSITDFNEKFSKSYFAARKEFKTRLATVLDNNLNINPVDLLLSGNVIKEKIEFYNNVLKEIENNKNFKKIKNKDKDLAEKIKFEGAALILGAFNGGGVSFDISELTGQIIDSLQFGVINGTLGFNFGKKIIDINKGKFSLGVGMSNFIPYVAVSSRLYELKLDEFKDLFPNTINTGASVSLGAGISFAGTGIGIDLSKFDENTKDGMEKMVKQMSISLDKIFKFVINGDSFEKTGLNNTGENQETYKRLQEMYKSYGDAGVVYLKEGLLNNYKRELYENAKGLNFTGVSFGAGIGFDKCFDKIVGLLGIHGEYHSIKWEKTQDSTEKFTSQSSISKKYKEGVEVDDKQLMSYVKNLDNVVTFRTRTNKYSYEIMNPELSLDQRWQGFVNFANRKGKFSNELQSTINLFKQILLVTQENGVTQNEKLYIISTITQLMKKSNDLYSGDLGKINSDYQELISIKNKRRNSYKNLLGFNTDIESQKFDEKLKEAGKSKSISEVNVSGLSFDASASRQVGLKRNTLNGVDIFFSNLQMLAVNGEPILVPITDKSKVNGFIQKLETIKTLDKTLRDDLITKLMSGEIELAYYSDPDGFDDRIIIIEKTTTTTTKSRNGVTVYKPQEKTTKFGLFYSAEFEKKEKPIEPTKPTEPTSDAGSEPIYDDPIVIPVQAPGENTPKL